MPDPATTTPKQAALAAAETIVPEPTGLVEYRSEGRLLIIGTSETVSAALPLLDDTLKPRCLLTEATDTPPEDIAFETSPRDEITVSGYMGAFEVTSRAGTYTCDLVLDLEEPPRLNAALPPPGYFAPARISQKLVDSANQLNELVGRFEKPQYFKLRTDICAHGASELPGCRRCLDACPAEAIFSIGDKVEVNPYLCQGGGVCATVCPTGAISYAYPSVGDNLDRVRRMLRAFGEAGAGRPALVLHTEAFDVTALADDELPLCLEELASVGLELWLSALAFGARQVLLVRDAGISDVVLQALQEQRRIANAILDGLELSAAVQWYGAEQYQPMPVIKPATFGAGSGGKREILFAALDHLVEQKSAPADLISLPPGAPLGTVKVDDGCTLCMACASVCPAKALADGDGVPALRFYETNCVQCGLCETACPEKVIRLEPRLMTQSARRLKAVVLNEEAPFNCVRCSKPFATLSVINKMTAQLSSHSMFQDEASLNRLKMCGDCRVLDMMKEDA